MALKYSYLSYKKLCNPTKKTCNFPYVTIIVSKYPVEADPSR